MTAIRIVSAAALSLAALAAYAQQSTPAQPAPGVTPMTSAQCASARKARHDHGIERGYGPMAIKGCGPVGAAKVIATGITGHDHVASRPQAARLLAAGINMIAAEPNGMAGASSISAFLPTHRWHR